MPLRYPARAQPCAFAAKIPRSGYEYGAFLALGAPASLRGPFQGLELVEAAAGALGDAGQRRLDQLDRQPDLVPQPLADPAQERAAAGEDDPTLAEIGRELGRRSLEGVLDRADDPRDRLLHGAAHVVGAERHAAQQAGDEVAPRDLRVGQLLLDRPGRADGDLGRLGGLLPDQQLVDVLDV